MNANEVTFESALTLESRADGTYRAQVGAEWAQGRAIYGGLVAALLSRALERELPPERSLRSCLIDFVGPVATGEAQIRTSILRSGRALTHGEARVVQNGEVSAIMVAAYGERRNTSLTLPGPVAPELALPETLTRVPYLDGVMPRFQKQFDLRIANGRIPYTGATKANVGGYVRHAGGGPVDAAGLLGLLDAWAPAVLPMLKKPAPASTVTWMVDVMSELPARGTQSNAFYRYEADGVAADSGYASCEARIWGPDGKLVAISRQMVVEFS